MWKSSLPVARAVSPDGCMFLRVMLPVEEVVATQFQTPAIIAGDARRVNRRFARGCVPAKGYATGAEVEVPQGESGFCIPAQAVGPRRRLDPGSMLTKNRMEALLQLSHLQAASEDRRNAQSLARTTTGGIPVMHRRDAATPRRLGQLGRGWDVDLVPLPSTSCARRPNKWRL